MFHDTDALRSKYDLERASDEPLVSTGTVKGRTIYSSLFEKSPLAQFQKRVAGFHRKAGLMTKIRWAIRGNSKFARLITNLEDLFEGLHHITTSARTSILEGHLIRQETESILDLRTLKIIEETCSDVDWKSYAGVGSSYLNSIAPINSLKNKYIYEWMDIDQGHEVSPGVHMATGSKLDASPVYHDHQRIDRMVERTTLRINNTRSDLSPNGYNTDIPSP